MDHFELDAIIAAAEAATPIQWSDLARKTDAELLQAHGPAGLVTAALKMLDSPYPDKLYPLVNRVLRLAMDHGSDDARALLGRNYARGWGVPLDMRRAEMYAREAADRGCAFGDFVLGYIFFTGDDTSVPCDRALALQYYTRAADRGNLFALCNLGFMHQNGEGVRRDLAKAAEYYQRAANGGDMIGTYNIALCCDRGLGIPVDHDRALYFYRVAAAQGYVNALCNLGYYYTQADASPDDQARGVRLLQCAVKQGHTLATFNLACCYRDGVGVPVDLDKQQYYYTIGARLGHSRSMLCLARLLASRDSSSMLARYWLYRAADAGYVGGVYSAYEAELLTTGRVAAMDRVAHLLRMAVTAAGHRQHPAALPQLPSALWLHVAVFLRRSDGRKFEKAWLHL